MGNRLNRNSGIKLRTFMKQISTTICFYYFNLTFISLFACLKLVKNLNQQLDNAKSREIE